MDKGTIEYGLRLDAYEGFDTSDSPILEKGAIEKLRQELVLPNDLDTKVPRMLEACEREAREVRKAIVTLSSSQLREARRSIDLLARSKQVTEELRQTFKRIDESDESFKQHPTAYKWLRQLHRFRTNVNAVVTWTERLQQVAECPIGEMLEQKQLIPAYNMVRDVQKIRKRVRECPPRSRHLLEAFDPYFKKNTVFCLLVGNAIREVLQEAVDRAVSYMLTVAELEEGADDTEAEGLLTPLRDAFQIVLTEAQFQWLRLTGDHENEDPEDGPLTMVEVHDALREGVSNYWADTLLEGIGDYVKQSGDVYSKLTENILGVYSCIENVLLPMSTKSLRVVNKLISSFHNRVSNLLDMHLENQSNMSSAQLVRGMEFTTWYSLNVAKQGFNQYIDADELKELEKVAGRFLAAAVDEMQEHMTDLATKCAINVIRDPICSLPNGLLYTNGPVDLFTILQKSIAPVTSMADTRILEQLSESCVSAMRAYINTIRQSCEVENWEDRMYEKDEKLTRDDWGDARMQSLCAYCNDMSKIEENLELVESKFASVLEADQSPFQSFLPELPDASFYFTQEISESILFVIRESWGAVFTSPDWNNAEKNPVASIKSTVEDYYNNDLANYLEEQWRTKLLRYLVPQLTEKYIEQFGRTVSTGKVVLDENFSMNISRDITLFSELWRNVDAEQSTGMKLVRTCTAALNAIFRLASANSPDRMRQALVGFVLDDFGDISSGLVEGVINCRKWEKKQDKEATLKTWKDSIAYQQRDAEDNPTVGWSSGKTLLRLDQAATAKAKGGFLGLFKSDAQKGRRAKEEGG
jgi:hypothetical protein